MNAKNITKLASGLFLLALTSFFQNCSSGGGGGSPADRNPGTGSIEDGFSPANSSEVQWFIQPDKSAYPNDIQKSASYFGLTGDKDGNLYAIGGTTMPIDDNPLLGAVDALITKFSPQKKKLWTKTLGKAGKKTSWQGIVTSAKDNAIFLVGTTDADFNGTTNGLKDCIVAKYDPNGNQQWILQFGLVAADAFCAGSHIVLDSTENIFISAIIYGGNNGNNWTLAGATNSPAKSYHLLVAKISPNGVLNSAFATGSGISPVYLHISALLEIDKNTDTIYAASGVKRACGSPYCLQDTVMVKLDSNLVPIWQTLTQDPNYPISPFALAIDPNGNPWIAGQTSADLVGVTNSKRNVSPNTLNGFIAKLDPTHGSILNAKFMVNSSRPRPAAGGN